MFFILSHELELLQNELKSDYQNLLAVANAVHILTTNTSVITGNCKQKPITYYLDEACRILYAWKVYQMSLAIALQRIDIRKGDSLQQFKNLTIVPEELSSSLDQFLLYSTFLFSPKWTYRWIIEHCDKSIYESLSNFKRTHNSIRINMEKEFIISFVLYSRIHVKSEKEQ